MISMETFLRNAERLTTSASIDLRGAIYEATEIQKLVLRDILEANVKTVERIGVVLNCLKRDE